MIGQLSRNLNPDVAFRCIRLRSPLKQHIYQICRAVDDLVFSSVTPCGGLADSDVSDERNSFIFKS